LSKRAKENIYQGRIERNLPELSAKNIKIVFPDYRYDKYILPKDKMFFFDNRLLEGVSSKKYNSSVPDDTNYHLILCRNRLLFFNLNYQNLMLDKHVRELENEGIIVVGFREDIGDYMEKNQSLQELDSVEKIYRKIR
jgi:chemotaxis methyl-accepting protein methylase